MEKKKRKYYKITAKRIPPWYPINQSYMVEDYLYAFSEEGAENTYNKHRNGGFGRYDITEITEVSKEEYDSHAHI